MAGYSGTPLPKKLGIKDGSRVALIGAPEGFDRTLGALPKGVAVSTRARRGLDVIVFFTKKRVRARPPLRQAVAQALDPAGGLWIAWPKGSSSIDTDLTENVVMEVGLPAWTEASSTTRSARSTRIGRACGSSCEKKSARAGHLRNAGRGASIRQVWIRNTSRYPDRKVRELVKFATSDIDMTGVCVNVKNGELAGGAYNGVPEMSNAPRNAEYLITLRLGNGRERWPLGPINYHFKTPEETGPRNRFPFFVCHDWQEWLVKLAAHEAMHIEQFREEATCSEIACEEFAVDVLEQFRIGEPEQLTLFAA